LSLLCACNSSQSDASCHSDPARPGFTFHITNGSTTTLRAAFGCGDALPITLITPQGPLALAPGMAVTHYGTVTCDQLSAGGPCGPFSDCGVGQGSFMPPGATLDISWDRLTWTLVNRQCGAQTACSQCSLGTAVTGGVARGELTLCEDAAMTMPPSGEGCTQGRVVDFSFDPKATETTVVVM
jgi:hypothetical protein